MRYRAFNCLAFALAVPAVAATAQGQSGSTSRVSISFSGQGSDRSTGLTARASSGPSGAQADGTSGAPAISADGRFVAFVSNARNLVPVDRSGCSPTIATYCTASTSSIPGCQAILSGQGFLALSSPAAFRVRFGRVPSGNLGVLYFGLVGPAGDPLGSKGGRLCVAAPRFYTAPRASGGTSSACDGSNAFPLSDLVNAFPASLDPGHSVHAALWFRDPGSPDGFALSDGVWFHLCP